MKKYTLEINEDELNLIKLSLSAAALKFRTERVKYSPEELKNILEDEDFEPFAEQQKQIRDFSKRIAELKNS